MIPLFPTFKRLTIEDKHPVEEFSYKHRPFSDHNFVSLYSYNVNENFEISSLNNNLIVSMRDYITGDPFITYLGKNNPRETIHELLNFSREQLGSDTLRLIPEDNVRDDFAYLSSVYQMTEEPDSYDYVLSIEKMILLEESHFSTKRQDINNFSRHYPNHSIKLLNLSDTNTQEHILRLFDQWKSFQSQTDSSTHTELEAITRLLTQSSHLQVESLGIYDVDRLIAFSVIEHVPDQHIVAHFGKANYEYKGVFPYLLHLTAQEAYVKGAKYWNFQQDLGIEGMKKSKLSWLPTHFLKKYSVSMI